jgi:hypothetical protein
MNLLETVPAAQGCPPKSAQAGSDLTDFISKMAKIRQAPAGHSGVAEHQ